MTDINVMALVVDCQRTFGSDLYQFFAPLSLGPYVIALFAINRETAVPRSLSNPKAVGIPSLRATSTSHVPKYGLNLYRSGRIIDPKNSRRFFKCPWAQEYTNQHLYSLDEIRRVIYDVSNACADPNGSPEGRSTRLPFLEIHDQSEASMSSPRFSVDLGNR